MLLKNSPFRIHAIQTDNGYEFQAKFHWHIEDIGIRRAYIKPETYRFNGKEERSQRTDKKEFYQMIEYKNDVDSDKKICEWGKFLQLQ